MGCARSYASGIGILLFARLADSIGRRPVALIGAALALAFSVPYFWFIVTANPALI